MGLPKMLVLNEARVGQTHKVKCRPLFQLTRCTNRAYGRSHPVEMFIKAAMPRDKKNQNSELLFRQTHEIPGCFQFWVFNPKIRLSTAIKCDPVFRMCVNDPPSYSYLGQLKLTVEQKAPVHRNQEQIIRTILSPGARRDGHSSVIFSNTSEWPNLARVNSPEQFSL
jgi:hypothetical protein